MKNNVIKIVKNLKRKVHVQSYSTSSTRQSQLISSAFPAEYLSPEEFILHLHHRRENRTCHWGFDPVHWRSYLHLREDAVLWDWAREEEEEDAAADLARRAAQVAALEAARRRLAEFKRKFGHPKMKRKQVGRICTV